MNVRRTKNTQKRGFNDTKSPSSSLLLRRRRRRSSSATAAEAIPSAPKISHKQLAADTAEVFGVRGKERVGNDGDGGIRGLGVCLGLFAAHVFVCMDET